MRKYREPYQMGKAIEYNEEPEIIDLMHFDKNQHSPTSREGGFRIGSIDKAARMKEGEESGSIADMDDEEVRNRAYEEFAKKIKTAVSSKLMGRKTNLKLKGHKDIVSQVVKLINFEAGYLDAVITGQAADSPALIKNKAIIDMEAKKLDRMLGTTDFWPFK
jgi:hypothetical protein